MAKDYDYITYEQFLDYKDIKNISAEYSDGYIYFMSPTHPNHNKIQNEIYFKLRSSLVDCNKCEVFTSDVAVKFVEDDIKHQFEPDVMVTCDDNFDGAIYIGTPNLIIEVLSRATKDRDLGLKLEVYEKFGVKEYWIVDINEKEITVYSDNSNGKYRSKKVFGEDEQLIYNNSSISVRDIFSTLK